jgi:hypothetical protein
LRCRRPALTACAAAASPLYGGRVRRACRSAYKSIWPQFQACGLRIKRSVPVTGRQATAPTHRLGHLPIGVDAVKVDGDALGHHASTPLLLSYQTKVVLQARASPRRLQRFRHLFPTRRALMCRRTVRRVPSPEGTSSPGCDTFSARGDSARTPGIRWLRQTHRQARFNALDRVPGRAVHGRTLVWAGRPTREVAGRETRREVLRLDDRASRRIPTTFCRAATAPMFGGRKVVRPRRRGDGRATRRWWRRTRGRLIVEADLRLRRAARTVRETPAAAAVAASPTSARSRRSSAGLAGRGSDHAGRPRC